jgi:hypothetical protein
MVQQAWVELMLPHSRPGFFNTKRQAQLSGKL